jgi:lantibiotic biosynthesis protein
MRQIVQKKLDKIHSILDKTTGKNDTFLGGNLGSAFYYYHLHKATGNKVYSARAEELVADVFERLNSDNPQLVGASFSTGGAGLGYAVNFLSKEGFLDFDVDTEFQELDKYLFNTASSQIEEDSIDYLHGALGVVHYLADRKPSKEVLLQLDSLLAKLCTQAIREDAGIWFRNFVIKADDKETINFGLSHGLTGILLLLIKAYPQSAHKTLIEEMVKGGIHFIQKHKIDIDYTREEYSFFPFTIKQPTTEITAPNRLAWCYGDLNEVLLFYRAGNLFNQEQWLHLGDLIGLPSLMRKETPATLVTDSHFCHGSSGLAQFYKTLYKERGLKQYKEGYEYWIEQTILLLDKDLETELYAGKEHDYLEGLLGVAFTLLSYLSKKELKWSESLLL